MKKIINLVLICSILTLNTIPASAISWFGKNKSQDKTEKKEKVEIVKPDKKKTNIKREIKKDTENAKHKWESSKEAEGMYETKFPVVNSQIEYSDMNGEVTLSGCIKLAITHHPTIMSAISNAEIYKTMIGQAWSNYFPTLSAGVS